MNSQWHCYYPGGNSSLSYPYHITILGGRGPYSTPGYAISKASIHTLPHQDFERGRKCCSSGCAFEYVTITSLLNWLIVVGCLSPPLNILSPPLPSPICTHANPYTGSVWAANARMLLKRLRSGNFLVFWSSSWTGEFDLTPQLSKSG